MGAVKLTELKSKIFSIKDRPQKKDCLYFVCPLCKNGHGIIVCWQAPSLFKSGAIWKKTGDSIENITIHPSINCDVTYEDENGKEQPSNCKFHGWVKNGIVSW